MKTLAALLVLAALPPLARAEEVWRWRDANGTLCYSNQAAIAPRDAVPVKTRLIVEAKRLPGAPDLVMDDGMVIDARDVRPEARPLREQRSLLRRVVAPRRHHRDRQLPSLPARPGGVAQRGARRARAAPERDRLAAGGSHVCRAARAVATAASDRRERRGLIRSGRTF